MARDLRGAAGGDVAAPRTGATAAELADEYKLSRGALLRALHDSGTDMRGKWLRPQGREQLPLQIHPPKRITEAVRQPRYSITTATLPIAQECLILSTTSRPTVGSIQSPRSRTDGA